MSRHLQVIADLIEQSMNNTAIAMDELDCDRAALRAVCVTGLDMHRALADGKLTRQETRRLYQDLRVAHAAIQKCIQLDEADLCLGREISRGVEMVAKRAALADGPTNTNAISL